jgi:guanosine-3',5'-bis(diphosphate) 3'-pyrophosphohydrolase
LSVGDNPEDFLEHTKLELFQDQVFCFTPKGQLIALPRGATPIDFAYAVHTDIGDTCVGSKINGRIMPLVTRLANGDEVEILRSGVQVPPPAWEEIVVTGKARAAIRRATKAAVRKQYSGLGMRILERTFNRAGKPLSRDGLKPVLHRLGHKDVEDVLTAVGRGELASDDVFRAVYPNHQEARVSPRKPADEGWFNLRSAAGLIFKLPGLGKTQKSSKASRRIGLILGNGCDADSRHGRQFCGQVRAGRRSAWRPHCRYSRNRSGNYHLSDPVAGTDEIR